ncbi:hypothetical protein Tco_0309818 [Tanacetum coccineum]
MHTFSIKQQSISYIPLMLLPRPSNPLPLQSHPSLDITFSLSPITPLDHMFETSSPPPPPPPLPQPPLMGHLIFFDLGHDIHGKEVNEISWRFKSIAEIKKVITDDDLVVLVMYMYVVDVAYKAVHL